MKKVVKVFVMVVLAFVGGGSAVLGVCKLINKKKYNTMEDRDDTDFESEN